ncbi:MAG TPA: methyltransferase domain-containing protein, partial [Actinomycetota bacterium]
LRASFESGRGELQVVERDDGYTMVEDVGGYLAPPRRWIPCERLLLRAARGRVLDVGAGAGRVALALQERGHDVVAIDTSEGALAVCADRGIRHVDRRSVSSLRATDGPFDTFALFGNGLGLLRDERYARWLLGRFRSAGSPSCRILGTARDPYRTDDPAHLRYHARNRALGRMGGEMRFRLRFRAHRSAWFDFLFLSVPELIGLAGTNGWEIATLHEDADGRYGVVLTPSG